MQWRPEAWPGPILGRLLLLLVAAALPYGSAAGQAPAGPDVTAAAAAGRKIFHGAGTCFACHGGKLEGTAIAPTLRAHKWRNGDGSLDAIIRIVSHGVPGTLMVSHPGGISDAQLKEVTMYVWAVSQGKTPP